MFFGHGVAKRLHTLLCSLASTSGVDVPSPLATLLHKESSLRFGTNPI